MTILKLLSSGMWHNLVGRWYRRFGGTIASIFILVLWWRRQQVLQYGCTSYQTTRRHITEYRNFKLYKAESSLGRKHKLSYQQTPSFLVSTPCGTVLHCAETKDQNLITNRREYLKTRSANYKNFHNFKHTYAYVYVKYMFRMSLIIRRTYFPKQH